MDTATEVALDRGDIDEPGIETEIPPQLRPMPDDLKEKGWKMSRVNGEQFRARNDRLELYGSALPTPEEAIAQARELDAGKNMVVTPVGTEFKEPVAHFSPSDEGEKSAIAPVVNKPAERTFDDELAAARELLREDGAPGTTRARMIAHTLFRLDGGTQPREQLDQTVIADYAEAKQRGEVFPPVDVYFDDEWMWLADGFHRYFSDQVLGLKETFANVHYGTHRDAVLHSLRANAAHGLPRSNADKRRAVLTLLSDPEWSKWSDNVIATKVSVSQPFVSTLRRELTQNVLSEAGIEGNETITHETPAEPAPQPSTRIGADGVERDTTNIGRKPEERDHDAIKVTDKRRVSDPGPGRAEASHRSDRTPSLTELLKGKKLSVSFTWIPALPASVSVSVNATNRPEKASRGLIQANTVPPFPEAVLKLITAQLESAPAPDSKTKSASKLGSKKVAKELPHKRTPAASHSRTAKKAKSQKTARKK